MNFYEILPELKSCSFKEKDDGLLQWQPSKNTIAGQELNDCAHFRSSPHHWFNTMLRLNNVCDMGQIEVPGAIVMLPWGMKIIERFANLIREEAEQNNYDEYAYPNLVPTKYFDPLKDLINIPQSVLRVSSNLDSCQFSLTPTGEYPIYQHWNQNIKSKHDLPKKIFQRTKYFRPITSGKRSGGSVFLSMEAGDVFEFHSAFDNDLCATSESLKLLSIFRTITEKTGTVVLWTLRPTWTNRGYLYNWCYGGDAVLPSQNSVQVACAYYQGDVFSRRFNIRFQSQNEKCFTFQATGAITRRMVFANLFQTIRADGALCLHPVLAPIQVTFFITSCTVEDENFVQQIIDELHKINVRLKVVRVENKKHFRKEEKTWYRYGIPLKLIFFGRQEFNEVKMILVRNDTGEECILLRQNVSEVIQKALQDIIRHHQNITKHQESIIDCANMDDVEKVLQNRRIAAIPLVIEQRCVQSIEQLKKGEVLGYYEAPHAANCVVTGNNTVARALVSRRI